MPITFNSPIGSNGPLDRTQNNLLRSFNRLSTGRRINSAADDAAGLAINQRLEALGSALRQGQRNLNDGISAAQTAEGGLSGIGDLLGRQRELSIQALNGTTNAADKATIQQEFDSISQEITRISQSTEFNGRALLDGSTSGADALTLEDGVEGGEDLSFEVSDQSAASLGVSGLSVSDPSTLSSIDTAINSVSSSRATIGSFTNRIGSSLSNLAQTEENIFAANSRIADSDFAQETADRTKNQILQQLQLGLRAQANVNQSAALSLLG